jgi:hypothetical protein
MPTTGEKLAFDAGTQVLASKARFGIRGNARVPLKKGRALTQTASAVTNNSWACLEAQGQLLHA